MPVPFRMKLFKCLRYLLSTTLFYFLCDLSYADETRNAAITKPETVFIKIKGQISKNLLTSIRKSITQVVDDTIPAGLIVFLDSSGGDGGAAMSIGKLLRQYNAHVFVTGQCSSACVFVLAGGVVRGAATNTVGIHRGWITMSNADAKILSDVDISKNAEARSYFNRYELAVETYLFEMGMSPDLFEAIYKFQRKDVYRLNSQEMRDFRLTGFENKYLEKRVRLLNENKRFIPIDSAVLLNRTARVATECSAYADNHQDFLACYLRKLEGQPFK